MAPPHRLSPSNAGKHSDTATLGSRQAGLLVGIALGILCAGSVEAGAQGQLRRIDNRAEVTYQDANGNKAVAEAATTIFVQVASEVRVTPDYNLQLSAGERRVLTHWVTNVGDWMDQFFVTVEGGGNWERQTYHDRDGDGLLSAADVLLDGSFSLAGRDSIPILLIVIVPEGQQDTAGVTFEIRATSLTDAAATAAARDVFAVLGSAPLLSIQKTVDRGETTIGDTLAYALVFSNTGNAAAAIVELIDVLPQGVRYIPGSGTLASTLTSTSDYVTVTEVDGRQTLRVAVGGLAASASGSFSFRVAVVPSGSDVIANAASIKHANVEVPSNVVETKLVVPHLLLEKAYAGAQQVQVGAEVRYTMRWSNAVGNAPVYSAALVDTLPTGLAFVSAEGSPEVDGPVIRWSLGTIPSGSSGSVILIARVIARPSDGQIINRVAMSATNTAATATAQSLAVEEAPLALLEVSKTANVLAASLGETVTYTITLRNAGTVVLHSMIVRVRLPEGTRLMSDKIRGADSVRVNGRDVLLWIRGELQPGESWTLAYPMTIVVWSGRGTLENVVIAEANSSTVWSGTTVATVRLRSGFMMESRAVLGKVWFDADGDGRQGPGEHGVGNVDIWSADGQVVTTDREGRFSFRNLGTGTHVLRIDMLGLPGGMGLPAAGGEIMRVRAGGWTTPAVSFRLINAPVAIGSTGVQGLPENNADSTAALPALIQPARPAEERANEERQSFIGGPVVRFASPRDGIVVSSNRLYVGVRGEAGAAVRLFNGDSLIATSILRPDGVADFVGINLVPGTNRLRVAMTGTWGSVRWDSVNVHRTGPPNRIEVPPASVVVVSDRRREQPVRVRVVDEWGVPVAGTYVTFTGNGAHIEGQDVDASSVGLQLAAGIDGSVDVSLRGGREIGVGKVEVSAGSAKARIPIRVVTEPRSLIITGSGEVGLGAASKGSAAVAVRGSINDETSVTLTYDSRRSGDTEDFFRRGQDLLDEGRYPTLGDGSQHRAFTAPRQAISARVERGLDWIELGDVQTADFSTGALTSYRRSLTGLAGRVTTGPLTWTGYSSMTDQVLTQQQLRADGTSGPYRFGVDVRPGTERLAVEVRARDNAARVISRQELTYGNDYQIEYGTGTVLLQRPLTATDGEGNPVFLVAMLERRSGNESRLIGGLATELDVARIAGINGLDTLALSLGWAHDAGAGALGEDGNNLVSGGFRASRDGFSANAELLRSKGGDSSAGAGRADLRWKVSEWLTLDADWLRVGTGFAAAANPQLRSGVEEFRTSALLKLSPVTDVRLTHEQQSFKERDMERRRTALQAVRRIGSRSVTGEASIATDGQGDGTATSSAIGKISLALSPEMDIWMETGRALNTSSNSAYAVRPATDHVGGGMTYRLRPGVSLDFSHRAAQSDSGNYEITSLKVRSEKVLGGSAWTGLERAGGLDASHSAVLGWSPKMVLKGGWTAGAMFERRVGLGRASLLDPVRALPFAQVEQDRWSTAAWLEYLRADTGMRFSALGELQGGQERRGFRYDIAGDVPIGSSLALITRHDWAVSERLNEHWTEASRRERSLLGLAYRPIHQNAWNVLGKLEWRRDGGPLSGSTLGGGAGQARLIGAADVVWSPVMTSEIAGRYAVRRSWSTDAINGEPAAVSMAHYIGAHGEQQIAGPVSFRVDGRLLLAAGSTSAWAAAPSLVFDVRNGLLIEGGYRFGALHDADFDAANGVFVTMGLRFSENTAARLADFWKRH